MIYIAEVEIVTYPLHMDDSFRENKKHTVEANSEYEAKEKIVKYYENKSVDYSVVYSVSYVEFFEHIS